VPNNVALVCPVHMPKFAQFREFVASYESVQPDCDLYFILSEEARHKESKYKEIWNRTEFIFAPTETPNDSVITYKKFYGIHEVWRAQKYEGIGAVDVDSLFVGAGFHESFSRFREGATILGIPLSQLPEEPFQRIVQMSTWFFKQSEELDKYRKMYAWWNTIPWYQAEHISGFLAAIGFYRHRFVNQGWDSFDQIMYHGWLLSEGLAKVSEKHVFLEMPEMMKPEELANLEELKLDWLRYSARKSKIFEGQEPLMYFHTDRVEETEVAA
jgi:hypothetical protein